MKELLMALIGTLVLMLVDYATGFISQARIIDWVVIGWLLYIGAKVQK